MKELIPYVSLGAVLASLVLSTLSYIRAGRWKDGDDATRLIQRVTDIESELARLDERMENVATKGDVERLTATVEGVMTRVGAIERGIDRIEDWLVKGART